MDEGQEPDSELFKTHGNASELFDFEEKVFYKCPLLVVRPIDVPRVSLVGFGRNTKISIPVGNVFAYIIRTIGLIP